MIKAIFLDFYGTLVYENGPVTYEVIRKCHKNSNSLNGEEIAQYWWKTYEKNVAEAYGEHFCGQYRLAQRAFECTLSHFDSRQDAKELCSKMIEHWCNPPIYEDSRRFLRECPFPVYIVSNSDTEYIVKAVQNLGLDAAGIITSEMARAPKPRKELFELALTKSGCKADEVIHIGDSLNGDIKGAANAQIQAWWINRQLKPEEEGIRTFTSLQEILEALNQMR